MKKRIVAFFTALLLCAIMPISLVGAAGYSVEDIKFSLPDDIILLTSGNLSSHSQEVKALGHTTASLKKAMAEKQIYAIGVDESNTEQYMIRITETQFSEQVGSLSGLNDEALAAVNREMFSSNASIRKVNETVYFSTVTYTEGVSFKTYQYVTLNNGKIYSFTYYGNEEGKMTDFMSGVTVKEKGSGKSLGETVTLVALAVIMVASVVAMFFIGASVVRDIRAGRPESGDGSEGRFTIKRRKK